MAFSGRVRPNFSLVRKIVGAEPASRIRSGGCSIAAASECLRNYATTTAPNEGKVKVPLSLFGGSGNYASALFISASKANALDKVESEILDIVEASKKSPVFSQFIRDLSVPKETRVKAVQDIFSEAGFSDVTNNFMAILAENGRLKYVDTIAKRYVELTMAQRQEVKAIVTTVIPLPAEEEKQLKETLQDISGQGKKVKLEQKITDGTGRSRWKSS